MTSRSSRAAPERFKSDDEGSILLLTLGYALLALAAVFVCVCATDLHIAQKRLDALADAAALAGADGFTVTVTAAGVRAQLQDHDVWAQASDIVAAAATEASLLTANTPDGVSAQVTVVTAWHPPVISPFVPDGIQLESAATSRIALR